MKPFLEVEATRKLYHADGARNSTHRSSLLVPHLPGSRSEVSFLNHFLLKRGIPAVGCRVTAIDRTGRRIESRLHRIDQPQVYTLALAEADDTAADNFLIEFFAAENLFIPFSAAMVNHHGPRHVNVVHSFNRVLNDVFEDDEINANRQVEAAIDVDFDHGQDTFLIFMSGARSVQGNLSLSYMPTEGGHAQEELPIKLPKLGRQVIDLSEAMPGLRQAGSGTLKVLQPEQFLFYGRMMAGRRAADGAFSANHSYYDSSTAQEYWPDARPALRLYPYFPALQNRVRFYPIMSPGSLRIRIEGFDAKGSRLFVAEPGIVASPGGAPLDFSVGDLAASCGVAAENLSSYAVSAEPVAGNTPTRVNHQAICGDAAPGTLAASVNVSLGHPGVFQPAGKKGYVWGQLPVGHDLESWLGISGMMPGGAPADVELTLYGSGGELLKRSSRLHGDGGLHWDLARDFGDELGALLAAGRSNIWYVVRSARADLNGFSYTRHRQSRHTTGEHNF